MFFFQAEDGIRDLVRSRGLGDVYKRQLAIDAVEKAKSGHPGMPMGMADIATVLWQRHLRHLSLIHI